MLRLLLLMLLLANGLAWAWRAGWMDGLAGGANAEREPERLARQVNPQAVTLLSAQAASAALARAATAARAASGAASAASGANGSASAPPAAASAPAEPASTTADAAPRCLEAGPLAATEVAAAEQALRAVTPALPRWQAQRSERGGTFLIYMGKYPDAATLAKKQDELRRIGVSFEEVKNAPALQPGLSLGRFDDRAQANGTLARIAQRGVKTARVVVLSAPVLVTQLRFEPVADDALRERLLGLRLPPGGLGFRACGSKT